MTATVMSRFIDGLPALALLAYLAIGAARAARKDNP